MNALSQRGFSIISAIFLVVIVALVAAFMVNIGSVQRATVAQSVVGARAHYAATSGIEWAARQVLGNPGVSDCFAPPVTSFAVSGGNTGIFQVTVGCVPRQITEGGLTYFVYDLSATAEFGPAGQEDYFTRTFTATLASLP